MKKLLLLLLPLLFVTLLGGAVWWKYGRVRDPFALAQQMIDRGDLKGAQIELRNAVRTNPQNVQAHFRLGQVQLRLGDAVAAEKELRTARDMGFDGRAVAPLLAQAYMAQGRYKDLLNDFPVQGLPAEQAAPLLSLRALAQLSLDDVAAAEASAADAERLAPQSSDAALVSARVAVARTNYAQAMQKIDRALQVNPRATDALLLKGQLQNLQGDRTRALESFDAALALNPAMLSARLERANLLIILNQDARAREDVDTIIKQEPLSAAAAYLKGVLLGKAEDYAGADAEFAKIPDLLPRFANGEYFLAITKFNLGQAEQAAEAARHYLARNPGDPDAIKLFVKIALTQQRIAQAIEVLNKVPAGQADVEMLDLLGRAYSAAGKPQEAIESLERAAALAPRNVDILTRLAAVRMSLGDAARASTDLEHALGIAPTQPGAAEQLVLAAIAAGEIDKATVALDRLRTAQGDSEVVGNLTALLRMAQLDLDGARTTLLDVIKRYPDATQARLNLAKVLVLQDKPAEARQMLSELLQRQPSNNAALTVLVALLLADNQMPKAVAQLEAAHNAAPKDADITVGLANLYVRSGEARKALTLLEQSLKERPNDTTLLAGKARAQMGLGQPAEARATYRQILDLTPTDVTTRRILADLLVNMNDAAAAKSVIAEGLKLQPGNTALLQASAAVVLQTAGLEAALAAADQLAKDPANLPGARLLRGDIYTTASRHGDAATAYAAELKKTPTTEVVLRLASALNAAGRADQAALTLRDWLISNPDDIQAAQALAGLDIAARRLFDAEAHLQMVLARRPSEPTALNNLAWVYQQRGDSRARPLAQKAYLVSPTPQSADTLGWILATQGLSANALTLLRQAASQLPDDPSVQYHLAVVLRDTGHKDEAIKTLEPILKGAGDFDDRQAAQRLYQELTAKK